MKSLLFITLYAIPVICIAQGEKKNGWTEAGLHGKVKILRTCLELSDKIEDLRNKTFSDNNYGIDSFSGSGQRLRSYSVIDGKVAVKTGYRYDSKGSLIETIANENGKITKTSYKIKYDGAGNETENQMFENNILQMWSRYKYKSGILIETEDSMSILGKSRYVYKYDNKGRVAEQENYSSSGPQPNSFSKFQYDDRGNRSEVASYNADGTLKDRIVSKYDNHNNKIFDEHYDNKGNLKKSFPTEYVYDGHGNFLTRLEDAGTLKTLFIQEIVYY